MIQPFKVGDELSFSHVVVQDDIARFEIGTVHPVYSTFALTRDAEWSGRLFVLKMKEEDEEGIGTGIQLMHQSPALIGHEVIYTATLIEVNKNEVVTEFIARVGERTIATGKQWQKILKKERLEKIFEKL